MHGMPSLPTRPASFLWLVAHEVRIAYRSYGSTKRWRRVFAVLAIVALPCLIGPLLAWAWRGIDASRGPVVGMVSLIAGGILLLFISLASVNVLRVFGERADLDLLLASPLPPSRVLAAKSVAIYTTVALPTLTVLTPFMLASAVLGHWGWLSALLVIGALSVIATSLAQALARAVFAMLSVRLARKVYQIITGLLGAVLFLTIQASNAVPSFRATLAHVAAHAPAAPLDLPALAALGAPGPLAQMLALAGGFALLTTRLTAASLGNTDTPATTPRRRAAKVSFGAGPAATIVVKELRLLARDPELLSQVLLQLLYLLPVFALLVTSGSGGLSLSRIATGCTAIAALLASSLSWLIVCAEDVPELLDAAPVARITVARAKLAAACLPPLGLIALTAAMVAWHAPLAAAAVMATSTAAAMTTALLQARFGKPQPRRAFRRHVNASLVLTFGELVLVGIWAASAGLVITHPMWSLIPLALLTVLLGTLATGRSGVIALKA